MIVSLAVRRWSLALAALLAGTVLSQGSARASTPSLVVDVDSGSVLHAERATDPWFPASVTKLMTAYVALEMVRSGRASLDQLVTISPEALAEPPSKMGFKAGTQLTLDNALKIIMVKSANDISHAIAETLGGSVEGFADLMNDASRRLGMTNSRWVNAHGLPDPRQWTTARDMAVLGRALLTGFPEHKDLFSLSAIKFGRRVMANHNGLLGRYDGVDGMKTGFICSSGFNVVASANRGGRRLITVVFGSTKAKERTLKAADLFDQGYSTMSWGKPSLDALPASSLLAPPDMRPVICGRGGPIPGEEEGAEPVAAGMAGPSTENPSPLSSQALAFAAPGTAPGAAWRSRELPPRAPLAPVLVWLGRDPAGAAVVASEEEDAKKAEKAQAAAKTREAAQAARLAKIEAAKAARAAAQQAKADAPKAPAKPAAAKPVVAAKPAPKVAAPKPAAPKPVGPAQTYVSKEPPKLTLPKVIDEGGANGAPKAKPAKKVETKKPATKKAEAKPAAKPAPKAKAKPGEE